MLSIAILVVYGRTLWAPFEFDDIGAIVHNATVRHLWPLLPVLNPPHDHGATVGGRPMLNLSFAVNYAISGESVWSYHLLNIATHIGCALLLFGIARRTIGAANRIAAVPASVVGTAIAHRKSSNSDTLAFLIATLWALHPLQTEAVTYLSQRAESLASLFYLFAIYSFWLAIDARDTPDRIAAGTPQAIFPYWPLISVAAVFCGAATKEIVCTAPLLVLLFDATFVTGSFQAAWHVRKRYYLALAASWVLLAMLAIGTHGRGGTAGFGTDVSVWSYLLTQTRAITEYLQRAIWPTHLVFDYGTAVAQHVREIWLFGAIILVLLAISFTGFVRAAMRPAALMGVVFFILLAPSSSFVPIGSQPVAEHRMYLPLAAIAAFVVCTAERWLGRWTPVLALVAVGFGVVTYQRNEVYRTETGLWRDTVAHAPNNARARNNFGNALIHAGRFSDAIAQYEAAVGLQPDYADAQSNLGYALIRAGHPSEAMVHVKSAVKLNPESADAWLNYALALTATHHDREAIPVLEKAIGCAPDSVDAQYDLGNTYYRLGDYSQAMETYKAALARDPHHRDARFNLAYAWLQLARPDEALKQFQVVVEQYPDDAGAHAEVGNLLVHFGRTSEAAVQFETALRLRPDLPGLRRQLEQLRSSAPPRQ